MGSKQVVIGSNGNPAALHGGFLVTHASARHGVVAEGRGLLTVTALRGRFLVTRRSARHGVVAQSRRLLAGAALRGRFLVTRAFVRHKRWSRDCRSKPSVVGGHRSSRSLALRGCSLFAVTAVLVYI